MNLRTKSRLSGEVFVCELGGFGISRVSHMLFYALPELFNLCEVDTSLSHFKRHFGHIGNTVANNVYKPFYHKQAKIKGVFGRLAS